MPEGIEDYVARIEAELDTERRLALDTTGVPSWDVFPFEAEGLRLKPLDPLTAVEAPRFGEDAATCSCADPGNTRQGLVWVDDDWRLSVLEPSGAPLVVMLQPIAHHDLTDLPDALAGQLGRLMVHLGAAIEALPSVGRVHVSKWGDGGAHLHLFFYARPARMPQLRGTCLALWDDFLPPIPLAVQHANVRAVVHSLVASIGGRAVGPAIEG